MAIGTYILIITLNVNRSKKVKVNVKCSVIDSLRPPWTVAYQAPACMRFSRQEYWSGLPFPSPGDLPDPGIKPMSPALTGGFFTIESPEKPSVKKKR